MKDDIERTNKMITSQHLLRRYILRTIEHSLLYCLYASLLPKRWEERREGKLKEKIKKSKALLYQWVSQSLLFKWMTKEQRQKLDFMKSSIVLSVLAFFFTIFIRVKQMYSHAQKQSYCLGEIRETTTLAEENLFFVISLIVSTALFVDIYKDIAVKMFGAGFYFYITLLLLASYFLFVSGKRFFQGRKV